MKNMGIDQMELTVSKNKVGLNNAPTDQTLELNVPARRLARKLARSDSQKPQQNTQSGTQNTQKKFKIGLEGHVASQSGFFRAIASETAAMYFLPEL